MNQKLSLHWLLATALLVTTGATSSLQTHAAARAEVGTTAISTRAAAVGTRFQVGNLFYSVISETEVNVDSELKTGYSQGHAPEGDIQVPATVEWEGTTYNVMGISSTAFANNPNISSITIAEGITTVQDYAFSGLRNMDTIKLPNSLKTIGIGVFYYCPALNYLTIPEGITEIPVYTFASCSKLVNIQLPQSLKVIHEGAFNSCSGLESITLPESVTTIGNAAFFGCEALTKMDLPTALDSIGVNAFYLCSNISAFSISDQNTHFSTVDGVLFNKEKSLLISFPSMKDTPEYKVPAGVKEIGSLAFADSPYLSKIVLPNGVEKVGSMAFAFCKALENINFPASVTTLEDNLIEGCEMLAEIHVGWTEPLAITEKVFDQHPIFNMHLYVPEGTESIYMTTEIWKTFGGIFPEENVAGIHAAPFTPATRSIYGLDGRSTTLDGKGIRLVRENGKVRKVIL